MPDNRGLLREVAWHEVFPWLLLFRTVRLAADFRKLVLAALGIVLTGLGWWLIATLFAGDPETAFPQSATNQIVPAPLAQADVSLRAYSLLGVPWDASQHSLELTVQWLTAPFRALFSRSVELPQFAAALLSALWALAVWALFGGAITRIAAVELALEERLGLRRALSHAVRFWPAFFAGPILPLVLIVILSIPLMILGGILRIDIGVLFAGLVWPLALICGLVMTLTLVGLAVGWPLMWATIGVDGTDSFDAFGRTYSYVYQRPLNYLFYAFVSLMIGAIGWIVVSTFAVLVIHLTNWGLSWGSGNERLQQVELAAVVGQPLGLATGVPVMVPAGAEPISQPGHFGATVIGYWNACVRMLAVAFGVSFLWTSSTGIYLLLRRDADAKETDEIYVEDKRDDSPLPAIKEDAAGVPVLADAPPEEPRAAPPNVESGG